MKKTRLIPPEDRAIIDELMALEEATVDTSPASRRPSHFDGWSDAIAVAAVAAIEGLVPEEVADALVDEIAPALVSHPVLCAWFVPLVEHLPDPEDVEVVRADPLVEREYAPLHGEAMRICGRGAFFDYALVLERVAQSRRASEAELVTSATFGMVGAYFLGCFAAIPRLAGADSAHARATLARAAEVVDAYLATLAPARREDVRICQRLHERPRHETMQTLLAEDADRLLNVATSLGRYLSQRVGPLPGVGSGPVWLKAD